MKNKPADNTKSMEEILKKIRKKFYIYEKYRADGTKQEFIKDVDITLLAEFYLALISAHDRELIERIESMKVAVENKYGFRHNIIIHKVLQAMRL